MTGTWAGYSTRCNWSKIRHVLDQFVSLVAGEKPDAVVICGDIYDRAVSPTDVVDLLNDVLSRLVLGCGVQVIMIAGNHDSAEPCLQAICRAAPLPASYP